MPPMQSTYMHSTYNYFKYEIRILDIIRQAAANSDQAKKTKGDA